MKWQYYIFFVLCFALFSCRSERHFASTAKLEQQSISKLHTNSVVRDSTLFNGLQTLKVRRVTETFEMDSASHQPYVKTRETEDIELTDTIDVLQGSETMVQTSDTAIVRTDSETSLTKDTKSEEVAATSLFRGIGNGVFAALAILALSAGVALVLRFKR